jgi:hypothetical protein
LLRQSSLLPQKPRRFAEVVLFDSGIPHSARRSKVAALDQMEE